MKEEKNTEINAKYLRKKREKKPDKKNCTQSTIALMPYY